MNKDMLETSQMILKSELSLIELERDFICVKKQYVEHTNDGPGLLKYVGKRRMVEINNDIEGSEKYLDIRIRKAELSSLHRLFKILMLDSK